MRAESFFSMLYLSNPAIINVQMFNKLSWNSEVDLKWQEIFQNLYNFQKIEKKKDIFWGYHWFETIIVKFQTVHHMKIT